MRHFQKSLKGEKGSLLVLAMWTLILISIFCFSVGYAVRQRLQAVGRFESRAKLRDIAQAGVMKVLYLVSNKKGVNAGVDSLRDDWSNNESQFHSVLVGDGTFTVSYEDKGNVRYGVIDEESKVNLNKLQSAAEIQTLFQYGAGLPSEDAQKIAASIIDWKDQDEIITDGGAETNYYRTLSPPYSSKNADLGTLEELLAIRGITPEIYNAILPYITLDSIGVVNINTAPQAVLKVVGFNDSVISKILAYRSGLDGIPATADDQFFRDISRVSEEIDKFSALDPEDKANLAQVLGSGKVSLQSKTFLVQCTAELPRRKEALVVQATIRKQSGVKRWYEQYQRMEESQPKESDSDVSTEAAQS